MLCANDHIFCAVVTVSTYSLFPLLFGTKEYPIKVMLLLVYALIMWLSFSELQESDTKESNREPTAKSQKASPLGSKPRTSPQLLRPFEIAYLGGLLMIEAYVQGVHPLLFKNSLPFLPLMLTSVYCSLGMLYFWAGQLYQIMHS